MGTTRVGRGARRGAFRLAALAALTTVALAAATERAGAVQDFPLPTGDAGLIEATQGPFFGNRGIISWNGALWFAEEDANNLGRITTDGKITEIAVPPEIGNPTYGPFALTAARDDQLWFLAAGAPLEGRVARLKPDLNVSYSNLGYGRAISIAADPAGGAWMAYRDGEGISHFDPSGTEHYFEEPRYSEPSPITVGGDGAAWFGDGSSTIKRLTASGDLRNYHASGDGEIVSMTTGPDGAVWYAKFNPGSGIFGVRSTGGVIGRMSAAGSPQTFEPPVADVLPSSLIAGPDGALWFTTRAGEGIGRMTTSGSFSFAALPGGRTADSIAFGPDGALWFTDSRLNRIGRLTQAEFRRATAPRKPVILSRSLKAKRKRFVKVRIACPQGPAPCRGKIQVKLGRKVIAKGSYHMPVGRRSAGAARFNGRGRALLRKRRSLPVKVVLRPSNTGAVTRKLRLKR